MRIIERVLVSIQKEIFQRTTVGSFNDFFNKFFATMGTMVVMVFLFFILCTCTFGTDANK
ncbi:MAG: hypothetical protein HGA83_04905 [Bacteroidales bacterium]|nr:hypothetical protein [Bacteroidales bacterium]